MTRLSRTRPALLLVVPATAALLAVPGSAAPLPAGAVNVVAGPQASATNYATTQLVSTAGTQVSFVNLDTTTHDVTSRATKVVVVKGKKRKKPIFSAPITGSGARSAVLDTSKLKPGSYDFFCSLHPGMKGVLTVR